MADQGVTGAAGAARVWTTEKTTYESSVPNFSIQEKVCRSGNDHWVHLNNFNDKNGASLEISIDPSQKNYSTVRIQSDARGVINSVSVGGQKVGGGVTDLFGVDVYRGAGAFDASTKQSNITNERAGAFPGQSKGSWGRAELDLPSKLDVVGSRPESDEIGLIRYDLRGDTATHTFTKNDDPAYNSILVEAARAKAAGLDRDCGAAYDAALRMRDLAPANSKPTGWKKS